MDVKELHRLQQVQFGILKEVVRFCDENSIRYYLMYGSLLGAIRHHGTIPWDNDIDICMNRENYEKFWSLSEKLPEDLQLALVGSGDEKREYGLTRVYKKGTLVYSPAHGKEKAFPIHIDVFVMDYAKKRSGLGEKLAFCLCKFLEIGKLSQFEKNWLYKKLADNGAKRAVVRVSDIVRILMKESTAEHLINRIMASREKTDEYIVLTAVKDKFPVRYFEDGEKVLYDGELMTVPKEWDAILTKIYGDYMTPPPEDKRYTFNMDEMVIEFPPEQSEA